MGTRVDKLSPLRHPVTIVARGRVAAAALSMAAILVGCSGGSASSPSLGPTQAVTSSPTTGLTATHAPSATPTSEDRIFTFDDGALTIIAPAGALAPGVDLVATALGPDDRPTELADVEFRGTFYRLEPDGLTFPEPIMVIRRVALADIGVAAPDAPLPIVTLALRTTDGSWSWLANQAFMSDGEYLYLSGEATHTSQVLGFGGSNRVELNGWALDDDGVAGIDLVADGVAVGRAFKGRWSVSAPIDAPAPPTINVATNPYVVSRELIERYEELFPQQFSEPFTHTGVLAGNVQVSNTPNWAELPADQRAGAFPSATQGFECAAPGPFNALASFEVSGLGAGSQLWNQLNLGEPSTTAMIPFQVSCSEPLPEVEIGAACVITVHTERGTYISYLRGLLELLVGSDGPALTGVEVTIEGANDDGPAIAEQLANNAWEFIGGLHGAGKKKLTQVLLHFSDGQTKDITADVVALIGGATLDVPFPAEPTFGTCPPGAL